MIVLADATSDFWSAIAHQGPFVIVMAGILWAGNKNVWMYTKQHDAMMEEQAKTITSLREIIAEKDKAATILLTAYETRMREKDEECDRVRERLAKNEGVTDRLLMAAIDATAMVTRVVKKDGAE